MKFLYLFAGLLIGLYRPTYAQQTTSERLAVVEFSQQLNQLEASRILSINQYLATHPNTKLSYIDKQGNYCYLHRIGSEGKPVYYQTRSNLALATSINTNKLWSGGSLGLNLQGQNMEVSASRSRLGVWEPGPVRTTHVEFEGRAITRDTPPFSTSMTSTTLVDATNHAAHVTGTMIAAGVRADVRGMANQARIDCYETTNELAEQQTAGSEGMLVSNHSYGPVFEKSPSNQRGVYDEDAQNYDKIAFNNRNYLQFHAAGNDRNEGAGLKYDILLGGALAKNVVAIGAVQLLQNGYSGLSSVVMSDFSSFGPADDGRIKPDFVAPGVQITSAYSTSDDAYSTIDGTSMASPGAAGSMFLLQQHYKNTKSTFMKSATLKGLGIHTAEEAGAADGPDYAFGWGLLNLEKAIQVINNTGNGHLLEENTLLDGGTYTKQVTTPGGPFKATISWTDVPGTPLVNPTLNNRTPSLVNDLDLRIVNVATSQVLTDLPWKLDPDNPSAAATRGDNVVDNVEQVFIANLPAGTYKLQVTHKGTLQTPPMYMIPGARQGSTSQDFSLFATGITSSALPVRLISFQGTPRQLDALLQWRIADAVNFSHFDVERSTDGKRFEMIQKVSYSAELTNYEFADMNAIRSAGSDNAVYYRLKLADLDGSFAFSRIVAVRFDKTLDPVAAGRAYPNPFTDQFLITIPADATLVKLLDIQGRVVRQFVPQVAQTELKINSLANLPAGIYLLSVQTPTRIVTQRLLKK